MEDKKKNLVIYRNELNTVPLRKFSSVEMNLFFTLCSMAQNKGTDKITLTFEEVKKLSNYTATSTNSFVSSLESLYRKLLNLTYRRISDDGNLIEMFVLFTGYDIDINKRLITIQTNPKFAFLLNDIASEFTLFELMEFISLKSSYAKTMYRLLKQYRKKGYFYIQISTFRTVLDIPSKYTISNIDDRVLLPILNELSFFFKNLKINKIKKGRNIDKLEFTFDHESDVLSDGSKIFRDKNGNFYTKHLYDFDASEVEKTYPSSSEILPDRIRKSVNKQFKKKSKENLEQLDFDSEI